MKSYKMSSSEGSSYSLESNSIGIASMIPNGLKRTVSLKEPSGNISRSNTQGSLQLGRAAQEDPFSESENSLSHVDLHPQPVSQVLRLENELAEAFEGISTRRNYEVALEEHLKESLNTKKQSLESENARHCEKERMQKEIDDAEKRLKISRKKYEDMKRRLKMEIKGRKQAEGEYIRKIELKQKEIDSLHKHVLDYEKQVNSTLRLVIEKEKQVQSLAKSLEEKDGDLQALKKEISSLSSQNAKLIEKEEEIERLKSIISSDSTRITTLDKEVEKKSAQINELSNSISNMEMDKSNKEEKFEADSHNNRSNDEEHTTFTSLNIASGSLAIEKLLSSSAEIRKESGEITDQEPKKDILLGETDPEFPLTLYTSSLPENANLLQKYRELQRHAAMWYRDCRYLVPLQSELLITKEELQRSTALNRQLVSKVKEYQANVTLVVDSMTFTRHYFEKFYSFIMIQLEQVLDPESVFHNWAEFDRLKKAEVFAEDEIERIELLLKFAEQSVKLILNDYREAKTKIIR